MKKLIFAVAVISASFTYASKHQKKNAAKTKKNAQKKIKNTATKSIRIAKTKKIAKKNNSVQRIILSTAAK